MTAGIDTNRAAQWRSRVSRYRDRLVEPPSLAVEGKLIRMIGLTMEAIGCQAPIGTQCQVVGLDGNRIEAEVVGFSDDKLYLMPTGTLAGVSPNSRVIPTGNTYKAPVGEALLGRVIDGAGRPLDGRGNLNAQSYEPIYKPPINPLMRLPIHDTLDVGVRALNAILAVGRGQRMGLFAGSGVGKSVLLGMMTKYTEAEVIVVGLIGERGREVKEFIENILGKEGMSRAVVVAAPADSPPVMRLHGAAMATAIAEHFRDEGKHVLLLMDSLTRYAQAQREIALAIGEPPATRGYPPSAFAKIPLLVERAGNGSEGQGSITAFYTVLAEGDDQQDPIADAARAILDGHIVLSRRLAESGHYPSIDIEASISRVMPDIVSEEQLRHARRFRQMFSSYQQNRDLISVGAYARGSDPQVDEAIAMQPHLVNFLQQGMTEKVSYKDSVSSLAELIAASTGSKARR